MLDLRGSVAMFAYDLTVSGSGSFGPLTATAIVLFVVLRPGISMGQRLKEFVIIYGTVLVVIQVWVNIEPRAKAAVAMPRPVIVELSSQPASAPVLGIPMDQFYTLTPQARYERLKTVLTPELQTPAMNPLIREHWLVMTDYGFPSGHSVGAMLNAILFLCLAYAVLPPSWRWPSLVVFVWMVAICYSRTMLREHAPIQVLAGGTIGVVLGLTAFTVSRAILSVFSRSGAQPSRHVSAA